MAPRRSWPVLVAAIAVVAVACGGGQATAPPEGDGTDQPTSTASATGEPSATSAPPGSEQITRCPSFDTECVPNLPPNTVELRGIMFNPPELTVPAGTTITFDNLDPVAHTATAGTREAPTPEVFDLSFEGEGDTGTVTLSEPGEIPYFCRIHPGMAGVLIIE